MKLFTRLILVAVVIIFLLFLFRPDFVSNAGSALLNSVGTAQAKGSAQFLPDLQGKGSNLQINLQGLGARLNYVVTLNEGSCSGKVLSTVGAIAADKDGNASMTVAQTDLSSISSVLQQGVWVNVHQGDAFGKSVSCGQLKINSATTTQWNSTSTTSGSGGTNGSTSGLFDPFSTGPNGFPQTGVAPAGQDSYQNYKFPRKY